MQKEKTRLEVDDRLAVDAEAEVPRLDDSGMNRTHCDLIHALPAHLLKRKRLALIFDRRRPQRVFPQSVVPIRPELMQWQTPEVRMTEGFQPKEIVNFALKETGQIPTCRKRRKRMLVLFQRH